MCPVSLTAPLAACLPSQFWRHTTTARLQDAQQVRSAAESDDAAQGEGSRGVEGLQCIVLTR